jgi:hypothetical protein
MNARVDQLFDDARLMAMHERSLLALALLDSLEGEPADESLVGNAWLLEAQRRAQMLRDGLGKSKPWDEAKSRIAAL